MRAIVGAVWAVLSGGVIVVGCAGFDPLSGLGSAIQLQGAIFVTDGSGSRVQENTFSNRSEVHLNGGPAQPGAAGLPDGTYVVGVTDPSGETLLSPLPLKTVEVSRGEFTELLALAPFGNSPNTVYKAWAMKAELYPASGPGVKSGFKPSESRTDNFRVLDGGDGDGGTGGDGGDDGDDGSGGGDDGSGGGSDGGDGSAGGGDIDGDDCPDGVGAIYGDLFGDVYGDIHGDLYGDQFGDLHGTLYGNRFGNLFGDHYGDQHGDFYGDQFGDRYGDLHGTMYGDTFGDAHGNVDPSGGCS